MGNSESQHRRPAPQQQQQQPPINRPPQAARPPQSSNPSHSSRPSQSHGSSSSGSGSSGSSASSAREQHSGPGAYRMAGQPRNQRFFVTVPRGVRPGQHFAVLVNGTQMMVRCPDNNRPGDRLIVTAPRQESNQFVVTVPQNVHPGMQFRVNINNQEVMVTCPDGVRPGQRVTFQLPSVERAAAAEPNHQMFEVEVPDGTRPGQPFALIANGQRVMVTCPPNVRPGQRIRFQLPILLSQEQLATIKVSYDKDGWMRCLGQDLKFQWCYNEVSNDENVRDKRTFKTPFDVDSTAFVRELVETGGKYDVVCKTATQYSCPTTVKGTSVNYHELTAIAQVPFQQKADWLKVQFNALRTPWEEGHMRIKVRRKYLLQDAMDGIESIQSEDMMKTFRFEFIGEPGLDAGGVAREFYELFSEQLFNPDCGLFTYSSVNQMCMQINPNSGIANEHHLKYFHTCGRLLGKALMDQQIIPVHLIQPLYKHLMGWPVTLRDLEHIDDQIYRNLLDLLDIDCLEDICLDFVVTEDHLGVAETVELVPGGTDITVTNENLPQYLEAQLKYRTLGRVRAQLVELLRGFYDVVPEPLLAILDFQELELLLHGLPNIDMDDWVSNTLCSGDVASNQKVINWFWEVVREFEQEQKAKLLQFVTGTSGVPAQGFAALQGNDGNIRKFTIHLDKNLKVFPKAHTCFNRIDLPAYKSKADMVKFMTMAINMESTGFGIE